MVQTDQSTVGSRGSGTGAGELRARVLRLVDYGRRYRRLRMNLSRQHLVLPGSRARAADPTNDTDFLINYPGSPSGIDDLVMWLPVLHQLRESATVSILVGDVSAYRAIHDLTDLPCYFGRVASEAEYVAQQLQTKVMLYINQSRLNLREAGFHDMLHVFLGAPGANREVWLNNRVRLYDYVLAPDEDSKAWMASRLMSYDADHLVRVVGRRLDADNVFDRLEARIVTDNVVDQGIDPATVMTELLRIRDERDRLVAERGASLAEQGIVLLKGGQA